VTPVSATDPTGNLYAYVATDGDIRLMRFADGQELARLDTSDIPVNPVHFSPAGNYLGVRVESQMAKTAEGYRLYSVPQGQLLWSFSRPVRWNRVVFTPDERQILLVDFDGIVHRLDMKSGQELAEYETGLGNDCDLAMHPRGEKIAFAHHQGQGRKIFIHDVATGERRTELTFPFQVSCLAWSPDGTRIAVGSDGLFSLWDIEGPSLLRTFSGHRRLITRITFHPQGQLIATCGYDGATRVWDAETGEAQAKFPSYSAYFSSPSGQLIVVGSSAGQDAIEWWDVELPQELITVSMSGISGLYPRSLDISSDGSAMVVAGGGGIGIWDLPSLQFRESLSLPKAFGVVGLPEPGCFLVGSAQGLSILRRGSTGLQKGQDVGGTEPTARNFTLSTLREGPGGPTGVFHRVAASQDGQRIAWIRERGRLVLWDRSSDVEREFSVAANAPCVAVSPSGRWVVSSDAEGLSVWDFDSGDRIVTLGKALAYCKATFDASGSRLVVGDEHRYQCWRTGSWQLERTIPRDVKGLWGNAAFSPDGRILAISSSRSIVKLLSATTGAELCTLPTAEASLDICHLQFTADGQQLAVVGENHLIQVWQLHRIRRKLAAQGLDWSGPG
jgi:WD40 repeat protein